MFRFFKQKSIPPCKDCANCVIMTWENLYGGKEQELRCKNKSNYYGDYCLTSFARGSRGCQYQEGTPTKILRKD